MAKTALIIGVIVVVILLFFLSVIGIRYSYGAEKTAYTVQSGDTLGKIAKDIYGDESKWRQIWEMNPYIKDPNLIYPGQVLSLDPAIKILKLSKQEQPPALTPDEFHQMAVKLMFKTNGLTNYSDTTLENGLPYLADRIKSLANQRRYTDIRLLIQGDMVSGLRALETYELAKSITEVYKKNKEDACLLLAIAWQETQFYNRRGKCDERGFFQFLPSTVKGIHPTNHQQVLYGLESSPDYAVRYTWWYIHSLKKQYGSLHNALYRYNGHITYPDVVMYKYNKIRKDARV